MALSDEQLQTIMASIICAGYIISGDKSAPPALAQKAAVIVGEILKAYH